MSDQSCVWCADPDNYPEPTNKVAITDIDGTPVCRSCADDYAAWECEQNAIYYEEGYDGPHYADTMSGGCVLLGGY